MKNRIWTLPCEVAATDRLARSIEREGRVWILGAFSWQMNEIERLLDLTWQPNIYTKVFLPDVKEWTRARSVEEAHSTEACANTYGVVPARAYFIDCAERLFEAACPVSVTWSGPEIVGQVRAEIDRLGLMDRLVDWAS